MRVTSRLLESLCYAISNHFRQEKLAVEYRIRSSYEGPRKVFFLERRDLDKGETTAIYGPSYGQEMYAYLLGFSTAWRIRQNIIDAVLHNAEAELKAKAEAAEQKKLKQMIPFTVDI